MFEWQDTMCLRCYPLCSNVTRLVSLVCVLLQIWDVVKSKRTRTMGGHKQRVGTQAWSSHMLSSGSRDRSILQRDVRVPDPFVQRLAGHKSEVCGLRVRRGVLGRRVGGGGQCGGADVCEMRCWHNWGRKGWCQNSFMQRRAGRESEMFALR